MKKQMKKTKDKQSFKNYCTIYLIRHGQTQWNVQRILQGHSDSPLTAKGKSQAKLLSQKLKGIKFDAIFSSDSTRAKKTADIIALEHKLSVTTTKALRERTFGSWEGKTIEEFNKKLKKLLDKYQNLPEEKSRTFKVAEDIETNEELASRFINFLREISVAYRGKRVLVVSHGGTIREFLIRLGFATRQQLSFGAIDNLALIKLLSDGVNFFVKQAQGVNRKKT